MFCDTGRHKLATFTSGQGIFKVIIKTAQSKWQIVQVVMSCGVLVSDIEQKMTNIEYKVTESCWTKFSFGGVMWKKASAELSKYLDPQHIAIALTKMINKSAEIE